MHAVQKETPRRNLGRGNGMPGPIDHWPVKNKFNGTRSNLKSKTNGGNRSIFCHVQRGRMYYSVRELEFITSRRERARSYCRSWGIFGAIIYDSCSNDCDAFSASAAISYCVYDMYRYTYMHYHEIFAFACSKSGPWSTILNEIKRYIRSLVFLSIIFSDDDIFHYDRQN